MKTKSLTLILVLLFIFTLLHYPPLSYALRAKYVFIVVIDGVRYLETFGDPEHRYIPHIWRYLRPNGTIYMNFYNSGPTVTVPGHSAILTGTWQYIKNDGSERPHKPTLFEYYRKQTGAEKESVWAIVGKKNLVLSISHSDHPDYGEKYGASLDSPLLRKPCLVELKKALKAKEVKKVLEEAGLFKKSKRS